MSAAQGRFLHRSIMLLALLLLTTLYSSAQGLPATRSFPTTRSFPATGSLPATRSFPATGDFPATWGLPDLPDSLHIVVLGSSTAAGAGASSGDSSWVGRYKTFLQDMNPNYRLTNLARGGYTTYHLQSHEFQTPVGRPAADSARNISQALSLHPSAIIINLPSNDEALNFTLDEQKENFNRIYDETVSAGIPLWVSTTQPRNLSPTQRDNLYNMRDWILLTFRDRAIDFWNGLADLEGRIFGAYGAGDGIHLNDKGHRLLFERVVASDIPLILGGSTSVASIDVLPTNLSVQAYPNPFIDHVSLIIHSNKAGIDAHLMVVDMHGRTVQSDMSLILPEGRTHIRLPLSSLPPGAYAYRIQTTAGTISGTIIKRH